MKLFIWEGEGVLEDYTSGMVVAIAPDLEAALKAVEAKCDYCMNSFPTHRPSQVIDLKEDPNHIEGWVVYGGG